MAAGAGDTAALVVALSAQLSKFERDMKQAVDMADKATGEIENKFGSMNPQIKASFFGNLFSDLVQKGVAAAKTAIDEFIDRFKELQKTAEYTGIAIQQVFGLQEAFGKAGASAEQVNTAVKSIALQLDQMQRGNTTNALAVLFQNNQKYMHGFNLETATAEEALKRITTIVEHQDNIRRQMEIGKSLGIPEEVIAGMDKYGDKINELAAKAAEAAPDFAMIAAESKAIAEYFKAAGEALKNWSIETIHSALQYLLDLDAALSVFTLNLLKGGPAEAWARRMVDKTTEVAAGFAEPTKQLERLYAAPLKHGKGGAVDPFGLGAAGGGEGSKAFDRQTESIEKHTSKLQADAATVGESLATQEEYRIQIQLTEAALTQYGDVSDEVQDKIAALAARAARNTQVYAEQTAALQRLNSASQQIGSALSTAFADAIVEGKSFNEVLSSMIKTLEKAAINTLIGNLFAPAPGQTASPLAGLFGFGGAKQSGGPIMAGRPYLVGEHGPEMIVPNQSGMVVPNDALRGGGGVGGGIVYSPAIDARGASVEAVARLAQIMEQDRAAFATRTVAVIQQARRGRVRGL